MLRVMTTALAAAALFLIVHPAPAQEESVDFTARGGVKDLLGRVDALEAEPDADTLGGLGCTVDQIAKFNGTDWVCAADEDALGGLGCSSDQIARFNGVAWECADIPSDADTLADLECAEDQIAKHDGYEWVCADPFPSKVVFVSSEVYTGALGGLAGATAKCQTLADAAGLGGTFKPWLATFNEWPLYFFSHSLGPYVLTTGAVVARDFISLTSGRLEHPIDRDENGLPVATNEVWTGAGSDGKEFRAGCTGYGGPNDAWTSAADTGNNDGGFGRLNEFAPPLSVGWTATAAITDACFKFKRIYCFEQ